MQPTIDRISAAFIDGFVSLTADQQRLAEIIDRLLAASRPAPPATIAEQAGWEAGEVEAQLDAWPAVFRNDDGAVVGFWGLTSEPLTDHRMQFEGAGTAWTWCSYDTLFIAPLLDTTARVTSRCPTTGTTVQLTVSRQGVTALEPATTVVSLRLPDKAFDDIVRQTLCHFVHFFASPTAADDWTREHPGTFSLPVADAFEVARRTNAAVFGAVVSARQDAR